MAITAIYYNKNFAAQGCIILCLTFKYLKVKIQKKHKINGFTRMRKKTKKISYSAIFT